MAEKTGKDISTSEYYIITINSSLIWAKLYMLNDEYNIVLVPLVTALPIACPLHNTLFPKGDNILYIQNFTNADFDLPNGTHIGSILYTIADYVGCGKDKTEIKRITLKYLGGPENLEEATIHVFIPVPHAEKYVVPLVLYTKNIMFVYKYINSSYFELDIKLFCLRYELEELPSKTYNITVKFLINMNSWTAEFWNGFKWIPIGSLPLATPALDLSLMLYKLYQSYSANVNYYLKHKSELQTIIDKIKSLIKNGEREKIQQLINQLASSPIPQIWRGYNASYLGKKIEIDMPEGAVSGPSINITFPAYLKIYPKVDTSLLSKFNDLIVKGIEEYMQEGRLNILNNVIVKNNGFIRYDTIYQKSRVGTELWTYMSSFLPAFGGNVLLALPAKSLSKYLGYNNSIKYGLLSISTPTSVNSKYITIEKNKLLKLPSSKGYLIIAIDHRLAEKWMLTNINAINPTIRVSILNNLLSVIKTKYINTWYRIVNGYDPKKEFKIFLSYLESMTLATAYRLGGENGEKLIENLILNGNKTSENINKATETQILTTSSYPSRKETSINVSSPGEISSKRNTNAKQYQIYVVIAILLALFMISLIAFMKKRG